ncbi:hypothetical protein OG426_54590 (plasmid) [Streptomyces canus]|uniref:hypothetical protein n=1 Tax=Streptomyces canus TaxID=58343 RepID=UPI002F9077D4|nr:hypothetical protein OG426_54590 [Streptomyces canus]
MTEEQVDHVQVSDNGVRSFIPPTFCFDLTSGSGERIATVSQIVMSDGTADFEALKTLTRKGLRVSGTVSDYDAGPQARITGRRFVIEETTPPD